MKMQKGKWKASFRDTYCLQTTLSPIIGAALVKFKEVITEENRDSGWRKGLPVSWQCEKVKEGVVSWENEEEYAMSSEDFAKCRRLWIDMLDECIYTFTSEEPDINNYNFTFKYLSEPETSEGVASFNLKCTNEEEYHRYEKDLDTHNEKVKKGLSLFGKHLETMWW